MYSFDEIIGHERIISSLRRSIEAGRVSHSYIFSGQAASGKKTLATAFTKALLCEQGGASACGNCVSCRTVDSGNNPDVFFIHPSKKSLGVDEIREQVIKRMETRPYKYQYKIFIIDQAHTMTVASQNALLKTIEEPAGYGIFLLLTENSGAFLPTVLSRCVVYKLRPLSENTVYDYLIKQNHLPEQAKMAAVYAQGNIGRAAALAADDDFINMRGRVIDIVRRLRKRDVLSALAAAKELGEFKERINEALDVLYLWYRDVAVKKQLCAAPGYIIQTDMSGHLTEDANAETAEAVFVKLDAVTAAKGQLRQNGNFALVIEVMLLKFVG